VSGKKRLAIVVLLFLVGLAMAFGLERCGGSPEGTDRPQHTKDAAARRVVSMAPSIVESLFAIGAGDRVAGVGDWCSFPREAAELPRVGGEMDPDFERLLALKPDLVIVQGKAEKLRAFCDRHGIPMLHVDMNSERTIYAGLRTIGRAVSEEEAADRLAATIRSELAQVARRVAGRPRPRVFLCMGHRPGSLRGLASAAGDTFLSELLSIAGGQNIFADLEQDYPPINKERLVERRPEVIVELHPGEALSAEARETLRGDWQKLASLPAVREGRIHLLTENYLMIPGPRVAQAAACIAEAVHPRAEDEP
jgi:iron complex transport system substrate-binding protein